MALDAEVDFIPYGGMGHSVGAPSMLAIARRHCKLRSFLITPLYTYTILTLLLQACPNELEEFKKFIIKVLL